MTECCEDMEYQVQAECDMHGIDCPDVLIVKLPDTIRKWSYALPIKDGGGSVEVINNCPWCGKELNVFP